jgi:hypothetical protein
MKMHFVIATLAAILAGGSSVIAQVGGPGMSPLSTTSPLAIGSGPTVAPTGIPLGATEMTAPGTSPAPPSMMGCSGAAGPTSQASTALFDGGGMAAASSACAGTGAGTGSTASSMPTPSTLRAGRANIPLGSTEMDSPGLGPLPPISTTFVSPIVPSTASPLSTSTIGSSPPMAATPPCPVTGVFTGSATLRGARSSTTGTTAPPGC